jgi:Ca2+:H+ antiporter
LLILPVIAVVAWHLGLKPSYLFVLSFIGLIPLASLLGDATEVIAYHTGPKIGSLLNATFGTIVELILLLTLLHAGQVEVVKASIVGAILMSLIVTVGLSQLLGGLKNGIQHFDREAVGMAASMMMLAVIGLWLPTIFGFLDQLERGVKVSSSFEDPALISLSRYISMILLILYGLLLIFLFRQPSKAESELIMADAAEVESGWSIRQSTGVLIASTLGVALVSEILSETIGPFGEEMGLSPMFLGLIILPLASTFPDILVGARMARKNNLNLSLSIASNSAMQDALFVAPILALVSKFLGHEMTLYFGIVQVFALALAVACVIVIANDAISNWIEGAQMLAFYLILALWLFFISNAPA